MGSDMPGGIMRILAFLLVSCCVPAVAFSQPVSGPYVSLGAGVNFAQDAIVHAPLGNVEDDTDYFLHSAYSTPPVLNKAYQYAYRFGPGVATQVSAGYGLGNGLRLEAEANFLNNHMSGIKGSYYPATVGGSEQTYGGMINALYDFDLGLPVFPYLGIGAGGQVLALRHANAAYIGQDPIPASLGILRNQNAYARTSGFAYQGIAGLAVPVPFAPGLSLTAEYRFMGLADPLPSSAYSVAEVINIRCQDTDCIQGHVTVPLHGERKLSNNFSHAILFGIRYAFGAPVRPLPARAVASDNPPMSGGDDKNGMTFIVFFDWDRADLSERARAIVDAAVQSGRRERAIRFDVNGYTDLSGTAAYNRRLSVRRAAAVEARLVQDGVPASEISIHGYGEANPLVPTAPGVREPQNRRVDIIFH